MGKRWIFVVQAAVGVTFALFGLIYGTLFWTGAVTDARYEPRPSAGPPLIICGLGFAAFAAYAIYNIRVRRVPLLILYREGFECLLIGRSALDELPLPALLTLALSVVSLRAFRTKRVRGEWDEFTRADITGVSMAQTLVLTGALYEPHTGSTHARLQFAQHEFRSPLDTITWQMNLLKRNASEREALPSWDGRTAGMMIPT